MDSISWLAVAFSSAAWALAVSMQAQAVMGEYSDGSSKHGYGSHGGTQDDEFTP